VSEITATEALSLDIADPRCKDGKPNPIGPPSWYTGMEFKWIVEGWNDGEGSGRCSYMRGWGTGKDAAAYAEELQRDGDRDGKRYDHYDVVLLDYVVVVTQKTYTIEEAKSA
jgi:hypothetical protein